MFSFFIIIFVIIIIAVGVNNNKVKEGQQQRNPQYKQVNIYEGSMSKRLEQDDRLRQKNNSYYSSEKRKIYQKQEMNHIGHGENNGPDLLCDDIGYVKCPKCGATVSKRSDTCFMCDAPLKEKKESQV